LEFHPLIPERWRDFTRLFGKRGAYGGCWCMWWRSTRREFEARQGAGNRRAMKRLVDSGHVPGIIGYDDEMPVAWCSVAPREEFSSLERSRVMKRLDDTPVWSLVCCFVAKSHRRQGVIHELVRAAVDHAARHGATVVEAYPTAPRGKRLPPVSSFMGVPEVFARAGFVECARPSAARRIMRRTIGE